MSKNISVLVLAAGFGSRLMPHTQDKPKCMLEFSGKAILEHQIQVYKHFGINDINIVTGHCPESVRSQNIKINSYYNPEYKQSNMVYSLMMARDIFDGKKDIIVAYGDIIFQKSVVEKLLNSTGDISLINDSNWQEYWKLRVDDIKSDVETFKWDPDSKIVHELGKKAKKIEEIQGQYIGLFKIAKSFAPTFIKLYENLDPSLEATKKMYMTDFLQYIIDNHYKVYSQAVKNGWLEFDSVDDLNIYNKMLEDKTIDKYYDEN